VIGRPGSDTRGRSRWPRPIVLVVLTAMFAFVGAPGSAIATPTYKYDVPAFARDDVHGYHAGWEPLFRWWVSHCSGRG
jgi:hypothetical protein